MPTAAVLPVKNFPLAKRRLGRDVEDPLRRELAEAMAGDVLDALAACRLVDLIVVVSSEPAIAPAARAAGALLVDDGGGEPGQSAAATLGVARAQAAGAGRVLCVPGDCPTLDPEELDRLLADAGDGVVVVPDRHGSGTNALLLAPPDVIAPAFGPASCARHVALAEAAGVSCALAHPASLTLDIDTGEDLAVLRARLSDVEGHARHTREVLDGAALRQVESCRS